MTHKDVYLTRLFVSPKKKKEKKRLGLCLAISFDFFSVDFVCSSCCTIVESEGIYILYYTYTYIVERGRSADS